MVFGGAALPIVVINLVLGFVIANVSIGGHLGGLVGGVLTIIALGGLRGHAAYTKVGAATWLGLAAIVAGQLARVVPRRRAVHVAGSRRSPGDPRVAPLGGDPIDDTPHARDTELRRMCAV